MANSAHNLIKDSQFTLWMPFFQVAWRNQLRERTEFKKALSKKIGSYHNGSYHNGSYRNLLNEYEVSAIQKDRRRSSRRFPCSLLIEIGGLCDTFACLTP